MGYATVNPPLTPHEHSSTVGDGGILDADETEVDLDTLQKFTTRLVLTFKGR